MTYPNVVPPMAHTAPTADVVVYREGNKAIAVDAKTKIKIASSTDHAEVIQAAIDSLSSEGGMIHIKEGVYIINNKITLRSGVRLIGSGWLYGADARAFLTPNGTVLEIETNNDYGIEVPDKSTSIYISDMQLRARSTSGNIGLMRIGKGASEIFIERTDFAQGVPDTPALIIANSGGNISVIRDCVFSGMDENENIAGNGIYLGQDIGADHVDIYDCNFFFMKNYGINMDGGINNITIRRCHLGFGFPYDARLIRIVTYGTSVTIDNLYLEIGDPTQRTTSLIYVDFYGTLYMRNITIGYSLSDQNYENWSSLIILYHVSAGLIERVVRCINFARSASVGQHEGFFNLPSSVKAFSINPTRTGIATFSGDGTTTDFLIGEHGLSPTIDDPSKVIVKVTPASPDAIAASPCVGYLSDEEPDGVYESVRVKFASAPASGTDNVKVTWKVEYIG